MLGTIGPFGRNVGIGTPVTVVWELLIFYQHYSIEFTVIMEVFYISTVQNGSQ